MQASDLPARFKIPFANAAGPGYIRAVPEAHQPATPTDAPASLTDGFPPETFVPQSSGGVPPAGADFNGILNAISKWARWQAAGGPAIFDSAFSTAVGGYPKGAKLDSTVTPGLVWVSTVDNNTTDPDGISPANWQALGAGGANFLSNPGYAHFANGLVAQWGSYGIVFSGTNATVSFSVPFSAPPFIVLFSEFDSTSTYNQTHLANAGKTESTATFRAIANDSGSGTVRGFDWLALGV